MKDKKLIDAIYIWLDECKKRTVKSATYDRLLISAKSLSKARIADISVNRITIRDLQLYVNELADSGYSHSTIKKQFNLITAYMKYAHASGIIPAPVYLGVKLPNSDMIDNKVDAYNPVEQAKLLKVLDRLEHPAHCAALLMLETGMRIGEVLALTWDDVIFSRKAIRINKTLVKLSTNGKITFVQNGAKTKTSNRRIPLSDKALRILEKLYEDGYLEDGSHYQYVFGNEDPMSYATVEYWVKKACKESTVPYKGLHIFRHTFASNCYNKGADVKLLSKLLGHADVAITYNTYIHLFGDELEALRQIVQ